MRRRFLGGAAAGFLWLVLGIDLQYQMPIHNGPAGFERAAVHGLEIYHKEIKPNDVGKHSSIPALLTLYTFIALGSVVIGGVAVLGCAFVDRFLPKRAEPADHPFPAPADDVLAVRNS